MALQETISRVKIRARIRHDKLDAEIGDEIDAALADLQSVGIVYPDENDPLILAAVKNYVLSCISEDKDLAAEYLRRYESQKAHLMMAEGYGGDGSAQ